MEWHNREKDWYNAERRFIFAAPHKKQRNQLIQMILKQKKAKVERRSPTPSYTIASHGNLREVLSAQ